MRHTVISVNRAKASFLELGRKVNEEGRAYVLIRDGEPLGALILRQEYEVLLETSDVLLDSAAMEALRKGLEDEKKRDVGSPMPRGGGG